MNPFQERTSNQIPEFVLNLAATHSELSQVRIWQWILWEWMWETDRGFGAWHTVRIRAWFLSRGVTTQLLVIDAHNLISLLQQQFFHVKLTCFLRFWQFNAGFESKNCDLLSEIDLFSKSQWWWYRKAHPQWWNTSWPYAMNRKLDRNIPQS